MRVWILSQFVLNEASVVILVQAENEFSASPSNSVYMQDIIDTYRDNGIEIRQYSVSR